MPVIETTAPAVALLPVETVAELISFITKEKRGKEPLFWKKEPRLSGNGFWCQSVMVIGGERVTFQYFPDENPAEASLSVWWRKDGTTTQETMCASSIKAVSGIVSSGMGYARLEKHFIADKTSPTGLEFAPYWQAEVNKRIKIALEFYRKK